MSTEASNIFLRDVGVGDMLLTPVGLREVLVIVRDSTVTSITVQDPMTNTKVLRFPVGHDTRVTVQRASRTTRTMDDKTEILRYIAEDECVDWAETPYVACDEPCFALREPQTLDETRASLAHWRSHKRHHGCSHGS